MAQHHTSKTDWLGFVARGNLPSASEAVAVWPFAVGDRVRLVREAERFPFFCARAGLSGVVVAADADFLRVRMEEHIPEAAEWDNQIIWTAADERDDAVADLEKVEG